MVMCLEDYIQIEKMFVWAILILTILYLWYSHTYKFWSSRGVPCRRPLPFFGDIFSVVLNRNCMHKLIDDLYKTFKGAPLMGFYTFSTPVLMVKDPEMIEHVMVKDFTSFMDRVMSTDPDSKGLNSHLLNFRGGRWRNLRNKLSPVFTSGKMKGMMEQLEECSQRLKQHLIKEIEKGGPLEAKHLISGYTLDVIGCCAFGLSCNAIDDPQSTFRMIGEKVFATSKALTLLMELRRRSPILFKLFRKYFTKQPFDIEAYMTNLITHTIKYREENNIARQDFLQLMVGLRKQETNKILGPDEVTMDDKVITSNSFVFLLAGYETTASTISFMLYELAVHQDVQERLYREIKKVLKKHSGELSWDTLKEMEYLEQVTAETLRKYPAVTQIRRTSGKPYTFSRTDVEIPAGTVVSVPVYSLHHDPQYYKDPEKFDPDRFSAENIKNITKFTYLPFGDGPRICIGMRFAKMEIMMAVTRLIQIFSVKLNPKTISPLQFHPGALLLSAVGGILLDFSLRRQDN